MGVDIVADAAVLAACELVVDAVLAVKLLDAAVIIAGTVVMLPTEFLLMILSLLYVACASN